MSPTLRSVVTQAWRSIGSTRRNFSSSPGSKGEYGFDFDTFAERNFDRKKLRRRVNGVLSGLFLAAMTVQHPAGKLAEEFEEERRELEKSLWE